MFITHEVLILELREPQAQGLTRGDVAEHLEQQVLDQLEFPNRAAELKPRLRVAKRVLVSARGAADRFPGNTGAGHT